MTYLLDTDYVIDYLLALPHSVELLSSLAHKGTAISIITVGEIYEGIFYGRDPQKSEELFVQFLQTVDILSVTQPVMKHFARLRGTLRSKGLLIGDFDLVIAATALEHNLTLVTRNIRDYQRIPGLILYPIPLKAA